MEFIMGLTEIENVVDIIKIALICMCTYYINFKIINKNITTTLKNTIFNIIGIILVAIICRIVKNILGFSYNMMFMILLTSILFALNTKYSFTYSLLITIISLSINYIIFLITMLISFILIVIFKIESVYIGLVFIIIAYIILVYVFSKIKRFKKGFSFLQRNMKNEYIDVLILDISIILIFCIIIISNYDKLITRRTGVGFIIFSIIMFITIQKSLQLYYKQKLQEREVEGIKEELKQKNKEIEELEKENLKLNKKNHSIAHKQKSLEYELKQIALNNQIEDEKHVKDKIENLSKEMQNETISIELSKTSINEIDNMFKYMQSECIKNKIDFQLQINGNIHHMVNKHIGKEELEILIADMIKNAIIAINHSKNINKSILVRLGLINGEYSLYIYDSGIEFEIDTLINLGIKPSTTHANDGGTGMGLLNTFDTLKKHKASLVIEEYGKPVEDNFTKVIKIIFDKENRYKISSYREEEIRERDIEKRIEIGLLQL